jgi:hypothetical protein
MVECAVVVRVTRVRFPPFACLFGNRTSITSKREFWSRQEFAEQIVERPPFACLSFKSKAFGVYKNLKDFCDLLSVVYMGIELSIILEGQNDGQKS